MTLDYVRAKYIGMGQSFDFWLGAESGSEGSRRNPGFQPKSGSSKASKSGWAANFKMLQNRQEWLDFSSDTSYGLARRHSFSNISNFRHWSSIRGVGGQNVPRRAKFEVFLEGSIFVVRARR